MSAPLRILGTGLLFSIGLVACGGDGPAAEQPVNLDYAALRIAESREAPLVYARSDEEVLLPLRNGLRLAVGSVLVALPTGAFTPSVSAPGPHSDTTVQVEGVDEADSVKYDGRYIYSSRPEFALASSTMPQLSRNVLDVVRTDPATAGIERVSKFVIEGEQNGTPLLYPLRAEQGTAEYLVAVSQNYQGWLMPMLPIAALVVQPDRTTIQLLDVRDPRNISQAWKLELDGWLRASRLIDDTLYLVSSYRPRLPDLILPADTLEKREANERRIRSSPASELMPAYRENGGTRRRLASSDGCLIAQQLGGHESYTDLLVIAAIDVRARRVKDVNCLSTNVNGVYMSRESLYVAGTGFRAAEATPITVLHKFVIDDGEITYRATGAVVGIVGWSNPSYFMDEYADDLRILTTADGTHHLTVLREAAGQRLLLVSTLPNAGRPAPIGKPGESVYAVRFVAERAYVVTFRVTDPLYVIELENPADPAIAGELVIPGFSTYLRPLGATGSEFLLSVGQEVSAGGLREGIKVELFDVRDITHPQSIGSEVFGKGGTWSEALSDPHALTFLQMPGTDTHLRLALPMHVFDTAHPTLPNRFNWTHSGLHLLEVTGSGTESPQLHFQGVIRTEEPGNATPGPSFAPPNRGILNGESVFAIHGERVLSSLWQDLPNR